MAFQYLMEGFRKSPMRAREALAEIPPWLGRMRTQIHNPTTPLIPMTAPDSPVVSGSNERDAPDYGSVEVPTTKPPEEFTYQERRADLLDQIRDLGHPSMINQVQQAQRFDVSQQQISKDLDRIAESVRDHLTDRGRRALSVDAVVQRAIRGLLEEGDYRKAARTAMEYDQWVMEYAELAEMHREIESLKANQ